MIEKEDGYTYLERDDIVQEGDEFQYHKVWLPVEGTYMAVWIGDLLPPKAIIRRKSE